jgi:hypothetical protein
VHSWGRAVIEAFDTIPDIVKTPINVKGRER